MAASLHAGTGRLEGKVAWVTGAASGIGLACAQRFTAEGATVVGLDLHETEDWKRSFDGAAKLVCADVRDEDAQRRAADEIVAEHGALDVVVTAAGVAAGGPAHLIPGDEWDRVLAINLKGTYLTCKAALPHMIRQRSGSIVTVASVEGLEAAEGGSAYNASKGGVVLFTKNVAMDYGRIGIRANAISRQSRSDFSVGRCAGCTSRLARRSPGLAAPRRCRRNRPWPVAALRVREPLKHHEAPPARRHPRA